MEEQVHDLHSFDGRNLSVGLEELHLHMAEIEDECTAKAVRLLQLVMEISDAQEVLASAGLILERQRG
jgi:hypothetical protein